tara:strand:- start:1663 stop:3090 length:1428 start_codon:yes stop_codon:yes gene_type:complete
MKNHYLKHFVAALVCIASFSVHAQKELKSRIVDFTTYEPIENASIYVQNSTVGTVSNSDGKFILSVPRELVNDTLVISSIGFKSFKTTIDDFDGSMDIFLEEDIASLDEILLVAETRPKTGNEIVLKAIEELPDNLPEEPYLQKGFLRHKERNTKEYKWLIESAITLYDSSYASGARKNLRINVDETRKSYDLRDVDSLYAYTAYLKNRTNNKALRSKNLRRDTIKTASLINAIKWNDERVNGLDKLFRGKLNLFRNANMSKALFGDGLLEKHQFRLDTVLVENDKKLYKIEILKGKDYVGLSTPNIYNEGFEAKGWLYIDWDSYAVKKVEYQLIAASENQKRRSKSLFGTLINHKLIMTYMEYQNRMYPKYIYYETPKLVNAGDRSSDQVDKDGNPTQDKNEFYYNTVQEIVFTEIIRDSTVVSEVRTENWSEDIFSPRPYNPDFWENYNVLLESEEEDQLIRDLSKRASLYKQ